MSLTETVGKLLPREIKDLIKKIYAEKRKGVKIRRPVKTSLKHIKKIEADENVYIGPDCEIKGELEIGRRSYMVGETDVRGNVSIGSFCAIAKKVTLQAQNHDYRKPTDHIYLYEHILDQEYSGTGSGISVGDDVWIGTKATVLPGVEVGTGAVIGANAVVTRDVEPFEIVGGAPAENIGWRFTEEKRDILLESRWWEWDDEKIRRKKEFFNSNIEEVSAEELKELLKD